MSFSLPDKPRPQPSARALNTWVRDASTQSWDPTLPAFHSTTRCAPKVHTTHPTAIPPRRGTSHLFVGHVESVFDCVLSSRCYPADLETVA